MKHYKLILVAAALVSFAAGVVNAASSCNGRSKMGRNANTNPPAKVVVGSKAASQDSSAK